MLQLAATWRCFLLHPNVPKIAPLALPSTLLPTCPPTRRDGPMAFMAIILWTPMTFNEHFLNLGLGAHVYYCSTRSQQYLNVLNANANCPLPPEVRVESVARLPNWYMASDNGPGHGPVSRQLYTPRGRSPGHYLSLSGEEHRGLSSNLTFFLFLSLWDFHSLVGCVPFLVVHSQARFHNACMHEWKWTPHPSRRRHS